VQTLHRTGATIDFLSYLLADIGSQRDEAICLSRFDKDTRQCDKAADAVDPKCTYGALHDENLPKYQDKFHHHHHHQWLVSPCKNIGRLTREVS
jgi:hypothetical protein